MIGVGFLAELALQCRYLYPSSILNIENQDISKISILFASSSFWNCAGFIILKTKEKFFARLNLISNNL
jgi:hypothetical protein